MGSLFNGREMHTNNYSSEMSAKMKKKKRWTVLGAMEAQRRDSHSAYFLKRKKT